MLGNRSTSDALLYVLFFITIFIAGNANAITATNDFFSFDTGMATPFLAPVVSNDDVDANPAAVFIEATDVFTPNASIVMVKPGGAYPYFEITPDNGYTGPIEFNYKVTDPTGSSEAFVSIDITNSASNKLVDDIYFVTAGGAINFDVADNDTLPIGSPNIVASAFNLNGNTLDQVGSSGEFSFVANGAAGVITFDYAVGGIAALFATVHIYVGASTTPKSIIDATLSGSANVDEGSTRTITLSRSASDQEAVSIDIMLAGGSQADATDFSLSQTNVAWGANDTSNKTVTLTINDDTNIEPDETLFLKFSNPTNGAEYIGSDIALTITATDTVSFVSSFYSVSENAGSVTIQLERFGTGSGAASIDVQLNTGSSTATQGTDFTYSSTQTVSWAAAESGVKNLTIPILLDAIPTESTEQILLELISNSNLTIDSPDTTTIHILEVVATTAQTSISASPSSNIAADGATLSIITVQAKDTDGTNLTTGGLTVTLTQDGNATISGVTDNANGTYTATVTNTDADTITISGKIAGNDIVATTTVTFVPGPVDATTTEISTSTSSVTADGISIANIKVEAHDLQGNDITVGGQAVTLTNNGGAIIGPITDNGDGSYSATITNTTVEDVTISGTIGGTDITDTTSISFEPGLANVATTLISQSPSTVTADGIATSIISISARDVDGHPLTTGGDAIILTQNGNAIIGAIIDSNDGFYTTIVTNTVAEPITVSGTINGFAIIDVATVNFIPDAASTVETILFTSAASVSADGVSTATITVQAIDAQGNPHVAGGETIALSQDANATISGLSDNGDGTYTATISSIVAETLTISGTIDTVPMNNTTIITFTPGTASIATSTISTQGTSVTADAVSTATITVQAIDSNGNDLTSGGDAIVLSSTGSASIDTVIDNNDGTYSATITNATAESVTISGTLNSFAISDTTSVSFVSGNISSAADTTITASPASVVADGTSSSTVTVQAKDGSGNNITSGGHDVLLTVTGNAIIQSQTDNGDGTYTATVINTVVETITISGSINSSTITTGDATINFTIGVVDEMETTIFVSAITTTTDDTVTITVQAQDAEGNFYTSTAGLVILISSGNGSISAVTDNNNGTYTASITNTVSESVIISGTIAGNAITSALPNINFEAGAINTSISTITVSAASTSTDNVVTITFQAIDTAGNNLSTSTGVLALSSTGNGIISPVSPIGNGTYTATITNTTAETVTISGTIDATPITSGNPTITFDAGTSNANDSFISVSSSSVTSDDTVTITVQAKDQHGNNLTSSGGVVDLLCMVSGTCSISSVTDNNNGTYTASINNTAVETVTIGGTIDGNVIATVQPTIIYSPGVANTNDTTISLSTSTATTDDSVIITVQARDQHGNNLTGSGGVVTLASTGNGFVSAVTNNNDGSYTATLINTAIETVTISGTIAGNNIISGNPSATFNAGNVDATNTSITASVTTATTDDTVSITVQAIDAAGNNVTTGGDAIALTHSGIATLSSVTDNGNGSYSAILSSSDLGSVTISGTINLTPITSPTTVIFTIGAPSITTTTISSSPFSIVADGIATSLVTVQVKDAQGNPYTTGGAVITLSGNGSESISVVADNGNGTYTATVSNSAAETVTISGTLNGPNITDTESITFTPGAAIETLSTISVSPTSVTADGSSTAIITIQTIDVNGNPLISGSDTIVLTSTGSASLGAITDHNNGTYSALVSNTVAESVTITGTLNTVTMTDSVSVTFVAGNLASEITSIISATTTTIVADGTSNTTITVQAKDNLNNNITSGGLSVTLSTTGSASISPVTDVGDGTYTATITSILAQSVTISGQLNGAAISGNETINFIPGAADGTLTSLTTTPSTLTADGSTSSTLTIQTKDIHGNVITSGGETVTLSSSGSATISSVTDNSDGSYQATITNTVAETVTITGFVNSTTLLNTTTISFVSGSASLTNTTISTSPATVSADGSSTSTITVQLKDAQGNDLTTGTETVALSQSGSATLSSVTDNGNGSYSATITSATAETVTINATLNGNAISNASSVLFTVGNASHIGSTILIGNSSVVADGVQSTTVTLQANDAQGNSRASGGETVTFTQNGSASIGTVNDNNDGTYSAVITNVKAETLTIGATLNGATLIDTMPLTFIPGTEDATQSSVITSNSSITADGSSSAIITVQVKDALGNNLTTGGLTVNLTSTGSAILSVTTDNSDGTYSATLTNATAENVTISGTLGGATLTNTISVIFIAGNSASTVTTLMSASADGITAGGSATITIQAKDAFTNNLISGGLSVTLSNTGNATINSVIDNGDGTYVANITNNKAESVMISGAIDGIPLSNTMAMTFVADSAEASQTTITATPASITADGSATATVTVQGKDSYGNNVTSGGAPLFLSVDGSAIISATTDNNDGTYTATLTNTVVEVVTVTGTLDGTLIASNTAITFTSDAAVSSNTTLSVSSASVTADGVATSTITVQAIDAQGNISTNGGSAIVLTANGSATISAVIDLNNGLYTATISSIVAETIIISATLDAAAIANTATVIFTPDSAMTNQTTLSVSSTSLDADGSATSAITMQVRDAQGNNLTTGGKTVTFTQDGSATISTVTDNADGTYTATLTNTVAEAVTVTGTLDGDPISDSRVITFTTGSATTTNTTLSVSSASVTTDGAATSTITMQVKDAQGNDLTTGGESVTFTQDGSATISAITDNADGTYTATITNTVAEAVTISATLNTASIPNIATVTFIPGESTPAQSSLSVNLASLLADGSTSATIVLQAIDAQGNHLTSGGETVTFIQDGNAIISTPTDLGDGSYTATVTSATIETVTISATINGNTLTDTTNIDFLQPTDMVRFIRTNISISEDAPIVVVKVIRGGLGVGPASVDIALTNQGSAVEGTDFSFSQNVTVEWADGEQGEKEIEITLIDDGVVGPNKNFVLALESESALQIGQDNEATINLVTGLDLISFEKPVFRAAEETGSVDIKIQRVGTGIDEVKINLTAADGTDSSRLIATVNDDYTVTDSTVTWADGETGFKTITIIIAADNGDADGEYFTLTLDEDSLSGRAKLVESAKQAEVRIFSQELLGNIIKETSKVKKVADALDGLCEGTSNSTTSQQCAKWSQLEEAEIEVELEKLIPKTVKAQIESAVELAGNQLQNMTRRLTELRTGQNQISITGLNMSLFSENVPLTAAMQSMVNESVGGNAGEDGDLLGSPWGAFINGTISIGSQDSGEDSIGYDLESKGITAGIDYRINSRLVVGGAIGYGRSVTEFDQANGGEQNATNLSLTLFGNHFINSKIYADWVLSYSLNNFDITAPYEDLDGNLLTLVSKPDGDQYSLSLGGGYDYVRGPLQITGFGRFDYINSTINSYIQSGGAFDIKLSKQNDASQSLAFGAKTSYVIALKTAVIVPTIELEWVHQFKGKDREIDISFAEDPDAGNFSITSEGESSERLNGAFSLTGTFTNGKSAYLRYDTLLNDSDRTSVSYTIGGRYEF